MPTRTPTPQEVLDKWRQSILRDLRVSMPARVEKYDSTTQLADLKPLIADFFFDEDDAPTSIELPVVTNVPVCWPGGGGFHMTAPLARGDVVTLLVCDRSLDAWLAQGGIQAPVDQRRHNLSDAVALAGLHDNTKAIPSVPTDGIALGKDGGTQVKVTSSQIQLGGTGDDVACASKVVTELNRLWTAIVAHTHVGVQLGGGTTPVAVYPGSAGAVGSSVAKVAP